MEYLYSHNPRNPTTATKVMVINSVIPQVNSYIYLGVQVDKNLSFKTIIKDNLEMAGKHSTQEVDSLEQKHTFLCEKNGR